MAAERDTTRGARADPENDMLTVIIFAILLVALVGCTRGRGQVQSPERAAEQELRATGQLPEPGR